MVIFRIYIYTCTHIFGLLMKQCIDPCSPTKELNEHSREKKFKNNAYKSSFGEHSHEIDVYYKLWIS